MTKRREPRPAKPVTGKPKRSKPAATAKAKATARCSAVEALKREHTIAGWAADGYSPREIVEKAAATWGIAATQTRNYYSRVIAAMREDVERDRRDLVAEGIARREALYRRLLDAADADGIAPRDRATLLSTARTVLTDIARLQALYAPDRAALARAGLDKQLTDSVAKAGAAAVREALRSAYDSRVERGLAPPDLGEPLPADDGSGEGDPGDVYGAEPAE